MGNLELQVGAIAVELGTEAPGIISYRSVETGAELRGMGSLEIVVLDRESGRYQTVETHSHVYGDEQEVRYNVSAGLGGRQVARVEVKVWAGKGFLGLSSTIVEETPGFEVASVLMEVFRVPRRAPGAALVTSNRSGRLIELHDAKLEREKHWVNWFEPAPIAMALHDGMVGVLWLDTVDSQFVHEVRDDEGSVTVELLHRHRADKPELSFLAQQRASCRIRILPAPTGGKVDWVSGAAAIRDTIHPHISDLYRGALIYKVMLQAAGSEKVTTYADVLDLIRRVHRIAGGVRQILYLVGWQHSGHDTGYPDVYTPNLLVGSFEDFKQLHQDAKAFNAIVSLHDNYHDEYMDSPLWDPAIACVNPDGELRKGGIWGGGQAYEIGPTKYVKQARERARRTVDMMGLEQTTHLDVLSDKPDMVDFDPVGPASREQNAKAKERIVGAFRELGIDVTSEVLTSPFVPWMHHFWHCERRPVESWGPRERIPLVPFLYHAKVTAGGDTSTDAGIVDQIEYGWTFSTDWSAETPDEEIERQFRLVWVPWSLLAQREMRGFERNGDWEKVIYSPDTYVEVNRAENRYRVVVDGRLVAEDYQSLI